MEAQKGEKLINGKTVIMTPEEINNHLLWEIWYGDVFIGTCTTDQRATLMKDAVEKGLVPAQEGILNGTEQRLIGTFNLPGSKVRSSFVGGKQP